MWRSLARRVRTWVETDPAQSWGEQAEVGGALIIVGLLVSFVVYAVIA